MGRVLHPVRVTVFHADRRSENEHNAADVFREGARVCFGNEVLGEPWSNAVFKNKNSTDPIGARSCGKDNNKRYEPTFNYMFGLNDSPAWEQPPQGSEKDRLFILYLPNKFVDATAPCTSPRTFRKHLSLEDTVAGSDFAIGHLLSLVQLRIRVSTQSSLLGQLLQRFGYESGWHNGVRRRQLQTMSLKPVGMWPIVS